MGAVLLTAEFPAVGTVMSVELRYRNSVAGALYEHDPDLIFPGSNAERAQTIMPVLVLSFLYFYF